MAVGTIDDRFKGLNQNLCDNTSVLCVEGLLDAVVAVYHDCNHSTLHRNKNLETFRKRFESSIPELVSRLSPSDFSVIQVIGRGAFGEVQLVRMKETKKLYAMKILSKYEMIRRSDTAFFWEERDIMAYTKSQWIVQLHYAFQDTENLYMVMDYMPGGNMVSLMERYEIPESWAQFYVAELVLALDAVHSMGYVHRDVKPENMLMDGRGHLKLADFGTCMKLDANGKIRSETAVGTPDYISPEVLKSQGGDGYYGVECDWWSVGVVTYEMLIGDLPFFSDSLMGTYSNIMNHKNTLQFKDSDNITVSARKFITQLLEDSDHRLRIAEIKSHTFFRTDQWTWDNIHKSVSPVKPELVSETDTQYFDEIDDDVIPQQQSFAAPVEFQGNHLPFVGFTFLKEKSVLDVEKSGSSVSSDGSSQPVTDSTANVPSALESAHFELMASHKILEEKYNTANEENRVYKKTIDGTTQKLNKTEKDLGIIKIDYKEAKRINEDLLEAKTMLESRIDALESQLRMKEGAGSPTKLISELEVMKENLESETEISTSLRGHNRDLKKELELKKNMVDMLESRCKGLAVDKEKLETQVDNLKSRNNKETTELSTKNADLTKQMGEKNAEVVTIRTRLGTVTEELQSLKNVQANKEKDNIMLKNSLQSLQQKHEALEKTYKQILDKTDAEVTKKSLDSKYEERIKEATVAKQQAEDKIGSLQHRSSLLEIDLMNKKEQMTALNDSIAELETRLDTELKRRMELEVKMKKLDEDHSKKMSDKDQEMRSHINEMKTEKQNLEDTIYQLKSELKISEQSIKEARLELDEDQKQKNILKGKLAEIQNRADGEGGDKEIARLRSEVLETNTKLTQAVQARAMAESKLADFEKEKMMIELDVKETIARHKTEVTERMAWAAKIKEQLIVAEAKLNQKNQENNNLQEKLNKVLTKLERYMRSENNQEDELRRLHHQLETEKVLKKEAVNKLTQVMFQRQPQNSNQKPVPRKSHDREVRKLKAELERETLKCKQVVEKYQQQLEEIQRQIMEETHMRKDLQTQLQQSESKLKTLQLGIGSGNYVLNGPSSETDGMVPMNNSGFRTIQGRETLTMQIPMGNDARKKGWRDVFTVLSYVAKKLILFEKEDDMGTDAPPYLMLEFSQIYSVRTLEHGEHERVRIKPNDAKRVIQLAYEEESEVGKNSPTEEMEGTVQVRGHLFVEARNSSRSLCDVCGKTLPLALLSGGILECKGCQMKCHKDDIDKVDLIQPCVMGEKNQKKLLLMIKNDDSRQRWLAKLISVAGGMGGATATRTTSPNPVTPVVLTSKHRDRGGSVRFNKPRPTSATTKPTASGSGSGSSRTSSIIQHRRQPSTNSPLMGSTNRQLEVVRNMDVDNARSQ